MPTITADRVIDKSMNAKKSVNMYKGDFKTIVRTITPGGYIGKVFSWYIDNSGQLWWMFYNNQNDYNNFIPSYVKHDPVKLDLPALPGILEQIQKEREEKEKQDKGLIAYYVEKYAPWIIGAGVVAIALPTVITVARSRKSKAVSGTRRNNGAIAAGLLIGGVLLIAAKPKKKRHGSVIVGPLDRGDFLTDQEYQDYLDQLYNAHDAEYELVPH